MRRLFIIRKDLHMSAGKLAAMVGHCCEAYWTNTLKNGLVKDMEYEILPVETEDDPDYWMLYRAPRVYAAAKAAHERGEKTFKFQAENPIKKYMLTQLIDKDVWEDYVNGIFTKTICEAKNFRRLGNNSVYRCYDCCGGSRKYRAFGLSRNDSYRHVALHVNCAC